MRSLRRFVTALMTAALLGSVLGVVPAVAVTGSHGILLNKGCDSPTAIGDPYVCDFTISNLKVPGGDTVGDDLTFTSVVDVVNRPGSPSSGNILSIPGIAASMTFTDLGGGLPSCTGLGTATPVCTLPGSGSGGAFATGSSIDINNFTFYTVTAADYAANAQHILTDTVTVTWADSCDGSGPPTNCPIGNQTGTTGSSTVITKLPSSTRTDIHDAGHNIVLAVAAGSIVHDFVEVTGQAGKDAPTGNITLEWFTNNACTGTAADTSGPIALVPGAQHISTVDATGFPQGPLAVGQYAFRATYAGDGTYEGSVGACEPLSVVDARISITPDAVNEVGEPHTFTATLQKNLGDGAGFVAAAGESISVTLANANGAGASPAGPFNGTTNASGQFAVTFTSSTAGTVTGNASSTLAVLGVSLTRDTNPATATIPAGPGGSGPAVKRFVDANITITPNDVNEVGQAHTFTVTVQKNLGLGGGFVAAAGEDVDFALADSLGSTNSLNAAASTCDDPGANTDAAGQCLIVFTSPTTGLVIGNASVSLVIEGNTLVRDTDPTTAAVSSGPGGSGPANKRFVNARISIAPDDVNEVGENHTFVVTVEGDPGDGGGFDPVAGASVTVTLTNTNGAVANPAGPFSLTTNASGQASVTFTSATAGVVTGNASATITVLGVTMTRDTDPATGTIPGPGGSGPATKRFVNANITITPDDVNEVGEPHTFVVTVRKNLGDGSGFVVAPGENVDFGLVNSNGAGNVLDAASSTCDDPGNNTDANGQCTIVFTSPTAGLVTGNASVTLTVLGVTMSRDTDPATATIAGPGGSGPAVKRFVDASIRIDPQTAQNPVNTTHVFTVTVRKNEGNGGFAPAAGESITWSFTGVGSLVSTTCGAPLDANGQCTITWTSPIAGLTTIFAAVTMTIQGESVTRDSNSTTANIGHGPGGSNEAIKEWIPQGECFVLWDEEALDNDFRTVENAARLLSVSPAALINDDRPTEGFNPPLLWNELRAASGLPVDSPAFQVRIPTGQDKDEGWYVLPPEISYAGLNFPGLTDSQGNVIDDKAWIQSLIDGTMPQNRLDKIKHVQPLRDRDLATMVGKTCVALVWDSDISMNYNGYRTGNLQGARLGLFTFQVLDVVQPQGYPPVIPESTSSTSFFDVIIRVLPPATPAPAGSPVNNVLAPDTVQITRARCTNGVLDVRATTSRSSAHLYIAVEGLITEESLTLMAEPSDRNFRFTQLVPNCSALRNKVVTVYSDGGGNPLAPAAFGSGGTYNARVSN